MKKIKAKVRYAIRGWHRRKTYAWTEFLVHANVRKHHKLVLQTLLAKREDQFGSIVIDKKELVEELEGLLLSVLCGNIPRQ